MKTADIISLHPGKQHNFEQAEQLLKYYKSYRHVTGFAISQKTLQKLQFLPNFVLKQIRKRSIPQNLAIYTELFPLYELLYKFKRMTSKTLPYGEFFLNRNRYFQKKFLRHYSPSRIFIGFDNSSELIFEKWKGKSILILDLTIAIPQFKKKLAEDFSLSQSTLENLTRLDGIWYDTYKKELELADFILCGSDFVKDSCIYFGIKEEKLTVIPYGANLQKFAPSIRPEERHEQPFKIAFVGNVSYRKGADVLLRAWKVIIEKYPHAELHFYGNLEIDLNGFSLKNVFFHGFIIQEALINELNRTHISILPTFFEGSSYAIYQSMALGMAVITTQNCGSIIKHMENGILIKYGSEVQISEAISILIDQKELRIKLARKAMDDVKSYSWDDYGVKLKKFISNL